MKNHAYLSASSSHRWLKCTGSVVLSVNEPNTSNPAAEEGTKAHYIAEQLLLGNTVADCDPDMLSYVQSYVDYVDTFEGERRIEQKIYYDNVTGISKINDEEDSFGTADCIIENETEIHIIDFKYGFNKVKAKQNTQLFLYAAGVNRWDKKVFCHIVQPRIDWIDVWQINDDEVNYYTDLVLKKSKEVALGFMGQIKTEAGEHCRYCPLAGKCRTFADYCLEDYDDWNEHHLTNEEISRVLDKSQTIKMFLEAIQLTATEKITNGELIPGYELKDGHKGHRRWVVDIKSVVGEAALKTELRSPSELEKVLPRKLNKELWDELDKCIDQSPPKQVLAPVDPTNDSYNME